MPHIYAIANTKGGVGKSTLAVNLAVVATAKGHKVLLVDADPQASSLQFLNARDDTRPKFAGIQLSQPILHKQLPELSAPYDYVFIDVGGRDAPVFRSALVAADTILVPMVPSAFDTWAADDVFDVLDELSASGDVDARVVLNQATPHHHRQGGSAEPPNTSRRQKGLPDGRDHPEPYGLAASRWRRPRSRGVGAVREGSPGTLSISPRTRNL